MKWEYKYLVLNKEVWRDVLSEQGGTRSHELELNKLGEAGWEVLRVDEVAVGGQKTIYCLYTGVKTLALRRSL